MEGDVSDCAEYCAVFVPADIDQQAQLLTPTVMLTGAWPGIRLCFRHLSACRTPRSPPLSFGKRAYSYINPSFSARPDNSLVGKIWYRKDGVPRSRGKGALFGDYQKKKILKIKTSTYNSRF